MNKNNITWDEYYIAIAKVAALRSKDPNTKVGAAIVTEDNRILSTGYNGAPRLFDDDKMPWSRDTSLPLTEQKYGYVCHSELNAILNYHGSRRDLVGSKIYVTLFPCNDCAKAIIQSGIKEVIYLEDKYPDVDIYVVAKKMFDECGVVYRQFKQESDKSISISIY